MPYSSTPWHPRRSQSGPEDAPVSPSTQPNHTRSTPCCSPGTEPGTRPCTWAVSASERLLRFNSVRARARCLASARTWSTPKRHARDVLRTATPPDRKLPAHRLALEASE
ncbi:hypothetical protein C8Q80DRAFT_956366 [Daedaleopsis nitida]|nr:hypothetical protein C8Q80DRAFT_956366 [Daedaleopsis nitida]